ncbi:MAG: UbiX family flavin prenyltransferase [Arcobacter sp.]|nr:UbiX family flavin prenyltransferase [Arcobacter sp.]
MKLSIGITGASGCNLALKFIEKLPQDIQVFLVLSKSAKLALKLENGISVKKLFKHKKNISIFKDENIAAPLASGSFEIDKMIILPCSQNTLAKCSVGIADTLITRAFTVMLKEKRQVVISPREMPLNEISLENMLKLSKLGVIIAPPTLAYYSKQESLEDMENFLIGKLFDLLKIKHNLYKRWK